MSDIFRYLQSGRVHPALILVSPAGPMRTQTLKRMAQLLLCRAPSRPCQRCSVCKRIERDVHPDVIYLREEGEETIKIDAVREICHQMEISSLEGGAKIGILEDAHRLGNASANAFLKTLEEPGPDRYFWLLTEQPRSLPPTLLSRCLRFRIPVEETFDEEAEKHFAELLSTLHSQRNPSAIASQFSEKSDCLKFVHYLQRCSREEATQNPHSPFQSLERFDKALELEGRLRSNANYGLLLETHLRQHYL